MAKATQGQILTLYEGGLKGFLNRRKAYGIIFQPAKKLATTVGIVGTFGGADIVIELGDTVSIHSYEDVLNSGRILGRYINPAYRSFTASMDLAEKAIGFFGLKHEYEKVGATATKSSAAVLLYALTSADIRYPRSFTDFDFNLGLILNDDFGFEKSSLI